MLRPLRLVGLSVALAIVGAACWLEVPNLHNTEGGYSPNVDAASGAETGQEPSPAAGAASETSAGTPGAEAPPGNDRDSS